MRTLTDLTCQHCQQTFQRISSVVNWRAKAFPNERIYCSVACRKLDLGKNHWTKVKCDFCGQFFDKRTAMLAFTNHNFCNCNCFGKWQAIHCPKKIGCRSKLERFLEERVKTLFPNTEIIFNDRKVLSGLELDIYLPHLQLAFELNGPWHYQPIFGPETLARAKISDANKMIKCSELAIDLCIIDVSKMSNFTVKRGSKILQIITDIITKRLKQFEQSSLN